MTTIEQLTKTAERIERLLCCRLNSSKPPGETETEETGDVVTNISYTLKDGTGEVFSGTSITKITPEGPVTTYFDKEGEPLDESTINVLKGNDILRHDELTKTAKRYSNLKHFDLRVLSGVVKVTIAGNTIEYIAGAEIKVTYPQGIANDVIVDTSKGYSLVTYIGDSEEVKIDVPTSTEIPTEIEFRIPYVGAV